MSAKWLPLGKREGSGIREGNREASIVKFFFFFFFLAKIYRLSEILKSEIQVGAK